jgi:branched-chain amino acid aminotransferase
VTSTSPLSQREMKVWIDGRIVDGPEARVPVLDHGLLYGDGIFEGIRIYGGQIFRLADHMRRLETGAKAIGLSIPGGLCAAEKIVLQTARAFAHPDAYVRLLVTRGDGELGVDPATCPEPRIICIVTTIELYSERKRREGLSLVTVSVRRPAPDMLDPAVKSLNYLNSVLAKREAGLRGADEALILNARGDVAEAAVANLFLVRGGQLSTPPVTDGALPGITRASVLEIAGELGLPAEERTIGRVDVLGADEAFLTGSGAQIVAVRSLDGESIGPEGRGPGPITERIGGAFLEYATRHGKAF